MSRKLWTLAKYDKNVAASLVEDCEIDPFVALMLNARGCKTPDDVKRFFCLGEELEDPFAMKDMDRAVDCINEAIDSALPICIYGDYDADGVTATAILFSYLEAQAANVSYYIPSRMEEGYGLCLDAVEKMYSQGIGLIITVDNGISALEAAEKAAQLGMKLIVTDHHRPGAELPIAEAVVDPHREDDESAFSDLAGVGVALKLVAALEGGNYDTVFEDFADVAAIGTIADIVPLVGENRIIVQKGLEALNNQCRCGIEALRENTYAAGMELNSVNVAFTIAPHINAAGRMGDAEKALRLLLSEDPEQAKVYAEELHELNTQRHETEALIIEKVRQDMILNPQRQFDKILVVDGEGWHPGVIGIVASRLAERYGRPAIVISREGDGIGRGSGRSVYGFSLFDALNNVKDMLIHFGGHTLAAGFSIEDNKIDDFRRVLNEYALSMPDILPELLIDLRLHPAQVNLDILDSLALLEPFGTENLAPLFGLYRMNLKFVKPTNNGKHMTFAVQREGTSIFAVKFGAGPDSFPYQDGDIVDLAVRFGKNEYMGETKLSVQVAEMRFSDWNSEVVAKNYLLYDKIRRGESLTERMCSYACPDRDFVGRIFMFIKEKGSWKRGTQALAFRLGLEAKELCKTKLALAALCELDVLQLDEDRGYCLSDEIKKVDLAESKILHSIGYKS